MYYLYHQFIFLPLYNLLVGIMDVLPWIDVGVAVIIFTCIIRLALFPLSKSALLTQVKMKNIEPEVNKLKAEYSDRQTQSLKIMELYKSKNIKPFSSVFLLFIQFPILIALISIFYKVLPSVQPDLLYSFIHLPIAKPTFLGLSLMSKNIYLAIMTAVIQYLQLHFSLVNKQSQNVSSEILKKGGKLDASQQMANSMNTQMKYFLPIIAFVSVYWIIPASYPQAAAIIAIYWSVSSLFTLGQEIYIKRRHLQ